VARVGERRIVCAVLVRKPYGKMTLEDLGIVGRLILKWMLENRMGGRGLDLSGSGCEIVVGFCVHGSEPSGSIKCREFLD
jgi:hypothetical protein